MLPAMKYTINTELEIEASPEQVWAVFGDFGSWNRWNDFAVLPVVPERVGKRCRVEFYLESGCMKQSSHDPEVLVLEKNKELRWRDYRGPLVSLFFRGSHWWVLEPLPNGHTRFIHGAEMLGLTIPFLQPTMRAIHCGYHKFNKALRDEVITRKQKHDASGNSGGAKPTVTVMDGGGAEVSS